MPAMCLHNKEGKQHLGLCEQKCCQQVKGGDPSSLLSTGEAIPGVLCPVLGSSVQKRDGHTGQSPMKGHEDD